MQLTASMRANSPALGPLDLGTPYSYHQGQHYCFAQASCRALSPDCCSEHKSGGESALQLSCLQDWLTCALTAGLALVCILGKVHTYGEWWGLLS